MMLKLLVIILFFLIFVMPQSFGIFKLPLLLLVTTVILFNTANGKYVIRSKLFIPYYFIFIFLSLTWSVIGLLNGNASEAINDSVRLYCIFMCIYAILVMYVSNNNYTPYLIGFFSFVALGISFFCFYVLIDAFFHLNLLGGYVKEQMLLEIGIHDGYTQMNNVNIGMFSFVLPFLFSSLLLEKKTNPKYLYIVIILSLASVILASRRIIMVLFILTPLITLVINSLVNDKHSIGRRVFAFYVAIIGMIALSMMFLYFEYREVYDGFAGRVFDIFISKERSLRQLQHVALMEGFYSNLFFGSGFGGVTDVVRNSERPWTYELTYSKILFNSGIVGGGMLLSFFVYIFANVIKKMRILQYNKNAYVSMVVGVIGVFIASASNPYMSSFDYIFSLSIFPLILNSKDFK